MRRKTTHAARHNRKKHTPNKGSVSLDCGFYPSNFQEGKTPPHAKATVQSTCRIRYNAISQQEVLPAKAGSLGDNKCTTSLPLPPFPHLCVIKRGRMFQGPSRPPRASMTVITRGNALGITPNRTEPTGQQVKKNQRTAFRFNQWSTHLPLSHAVSTIAPPLEDPPPEERFIELSSQQHARSPNIYGHQTYNIA